MKTTRLAWAGLLALLLQGGCALKPIAVTGKEGPTSNGSQSETSFAVNRVGDAVTITVGFNDDTAQPQIQYTATTRTTKKNATLMGWSYSTDFGNSWTYGGRISPNADWPVLWSDPGLTNSARDQRHVYMAYLAVPKAKMDLAPGSGISGPLNGYIGGACIARSGDAGKSFSLSQCLRTTETDSTGDFYDGGNMASDGAGNIYAGWINVDTNRIHIWRAAGETASFQKLVNPFPNEYMVSHPRLRVNPDNGELFVMALHLSGELLLSRWNGSAWSGVWHTGMYAQGYPCIATNGTVGCAADSMIRAGPQFAFDIGSFGKANDHVRILFTRKSGVNGHLYIAGAGCNIGNEACQYIPEWGTGEGNKEKVESSFNPLLRAYRSEEMARNGEPSLWMGSHTTYVPSTGRVTFAMGGVAMLTTQNNTNLFIYLAISLLADRIVCSDLRGYWGDYDDLQALGPTPSRQSVAFARTFTDSNLGCSQRWQYNSSAVHVGFTVP
jgi:hypothetical protein